MMNLIRLLFYLIRLVLFVAFLFLGSWLTLIGIAILLYVEVVWYGLDGEAGFWFLLLAGLLRPGFRKVADAIEPHGGPGLRRKTKAPKALPTSTVTGLARAIDSPDEVTITGRLHPNYQRLLDPPGRPLDMNIYPDQAAPIDGAATPANVPAPRPQSP